MSSSFFRRITRYPQRTHVNQRENRLTEATASVMQHSHELATSFVRALDLWDDLRDSTISQFRITTQKMVRGSNRRGFVDLEIIATTEDPSGSTRDYIAWIEVKHGSEISGDQLDVYAAAASGADPPPRLVLLASRFSEPQGSSDLFERRFWQDLADRLKKDRPPKDDSADSWLWRQYLHFLNEEELMDDDRLSIESVYAMSNMFEADRAVESVIRRAIPAIEEGWGPRASGAQRGRGLGLWQHFEWKHQVHNRYLELMVAPGVHLSDPSKGHMFFAGLSFKPGTDPFPEEADASALLPDFEVWADDWGKRRMRTLRPESLLQTDDPDAQAQLLADWAVETFESLDASFR